MKWLKNLYFTSNFFWFLLGLVGLYILAFILPGLLLPVKILTGIFFLIVLVDIFFLFGKKKIIRLQRLYPSKLSNGDENEFKLIIESKFPYKIQAKIIEELPFQFQFRDFVLHTELLPSDPQTLSYHLTPHERGIYAFGLCNVLVRKLGLVMRKYRLGEPTTFACYPSFIQLKKYRLLATTNRLNEAGIKRIRKIGNTLEFERIREYVQGDDYRFINWKATAKVRKVMVNQYEDEKSQPIYSFIDLGRAMRMPFNQLTLLDYAINSSLVLSNIAILKHDRAGLLTFSKKIDRHISAAKKPGQMQLIMDELYKIKTDFSESEFGRLYTYAKRNINQRALIMLYTNFETLDAMNRQLGYLRLLNKSHIVVIVIFKNTELRKLSEKPAHAPAKIYNQIIAEKLIYEKQLIIQKLQANGLQTILTEPENLTINSINKYLELKARGMI